MRREERVAMVVNDEPAFMAWFLGAMRSGIVPVPLSTMLTGDELGAVVADAGAPIAGIFGQVRGQRNRKMGRPDQGERRHGGLTFCCLLLV